MELSDLMTFSTVARLGGVTRAADELNTVQSNITQRVKALEAEIGTPLFERHSRGMTLTGAGRRLLPYAQRLAALSREAVLAARDDGEPKGPLSIGSMETTAAVRLPSLLAEFHRRFPAVQLSLRTAPTADLVAAVLDGSLDGAFVAGPIEHAELTDVTAFREELVLVTRAPMGQPRGASRRHARIRADRAGVPHRLHLPAAAGAGADRVRLAVRRAVRTRHARRHDRLRRRRHGRHAAAARGGRTQRPERQHPHPPARARRSRGSIPSSSSAAARISTVPCRVLSLAWRRTARSLPPEASRPSFPRGENRCHKFATN